MKKSFFIVCLFLVIRVFSASHITADSTYVKYSQQRFIFNGNVQLDSPHLHLTAEQLEYTKKNIQAQGHVQLNLKQDNIDVSAEFLKREGKITTVHTPKGKVLVHDQKNERNMESQKMIIRDGVNSKKIIHFQGDPVLTEQSIKATAKDEIIYNQLENKVFFMGTSKIEDKEENTQIQSKDIVLLQASQKLLFHNSVNISDDQNHFLSASTGNYDIHTKYLNMDKNVQYIGDIAKIFSDRLRTTEKKDKQDIKPHLIYIFEKNIKINYQSFVGTSRQILVDPEKNYTELLDNVYLKGSDNGLEVKCDLMDIMEKERKSYFYNNVKLIDKNRVFTSDVATYDDRTKIFTLRGNASYTKDQSHYTAQTIYLNNNDLSIRFIGQVQGSSPLDGLGGIQVEGEL